MGLDKALVTNISCSELKFIVSKLRVNVVASISWFTVSGFLLISYIDVAGKHEGPVWACSVWCGV